MDSVLFSLIFSPTIPIFQIVLIHVSKKSGIAVRLMFLSFCLYISLCLGLTCFLNETFELPLDKLVSSLSASIFMCLLYMEVFSMIARGFSMQIITDIYTNNGLTIEGVIAKYADGKGIDWMLEKRIEGIKNLNLIHYNSGGIELRSNFGYLIGKLGINYKKFLKLGKGG